MTGVRIIEFEGRRVAFPADATDEEIGKVLMGSPPAPPRTMSDDVNDITRQLGLGVRGVVGGVGDALAIVGDPVNELINLGLRQFGLPEINSVSGATQQNLSAAGLPAPATPSERVNDAIIRGGAGALVPAGGAAAAGGRVAGPVVSALDVLSIAPATQTVVGAAAGGAGQAAQEAGAGPIGQTAAAITGGLFAGAVPSTLQGAGNAIGATAGGVVNATTRAGRDAMVADALRKNSSDASSLLDRLIAGEDSLVPGSARTTSRVADDPQLMVLERAIPSIYPDKAAELSAAAARNNDARIAAVRGVAPEGANAGQLAQRLQTELRRYQEGMDEAISLATRDVTQGNRELGANIDAQSAGAIIRQQLDERLKGSRQRVSALYDAIDPEDQTRISTAPILDRLQDRVTRQFVRSGREIPAEIQDVMTRLMQRPEMTWAQIDGLMQDVGSMQGIAFNAGNQGLSNVLKDVRGNILGAVDESVQSVIDAGKAGRPAPAGGMTPEQAARYSMARTARSEQGRIFEEGAVGPVLERNQFNRPEMQDSLIPGQFVGKGKPPEAIQQFIEASGGRGPALEAIRDYMVTGLRDFATNADGTIDAAKWRKWMTDHRSSLDAFPELRRQFDGVAKSQDVLDRLGERRTRTLEDVRKSALGYFTGSKNPDDAIADIMRDKSSNAKMAELVDAIKGDKDAMDGLRAGVRDWLLNYGSNEGVNQTGVRQMSQATFNEMVRDYGATLSQIYSPDQMKALRAVAADLSDESRILSAGSPRNSVTSQNMTLASIIGRMTGGALDQTSPILGPYVKAMRFLLSGSEEAVRARLVEAMLDPEVARQLLRTVNPKNVVSTEQAIERLKQTMVRRIGGAALGVATGAAGDQDSTALPGSPTEVAQ